MRQLTPNTNDNLLVGPETGDDAAVWKLSDDRALVVTADFITPVVDDARSWGRVAAANSVSDIYAMGATPLLALNLVGWNAEELPTSLLSEVLAGADEIAAEAGFVVAGGHTVDDPEPKFGMAVVGEAHPDRLLRNTELRAEQALVLTKPLGVGVITTAIKRGLASSAEADAAIASMCALNDTAAAVAVAQGATGATDVTGFGLLGHLGQMAAASGVDVAIDVASVPLLPGTRALAEQGAIPGGSQRNLRWVHDRLDAGAASELEVVLLADAQTSGGLVFGVDSDRVDVVSTALASAGLTFAVIGSTAAGSGQIRLD